MSDPYAAPAAPVYPESSSAPSSVSDLSWPLAQGAGWVKFIGILLIILGALMCITIIGAVIGWFPIWVGVIFTRSADAIGRAHQNNDPVALKESLGKLGTLFVIQGVLNIISIVGGVIAFLVIFLMFGNTIMELLKNMQFPH